MRLRVFLLTILVELLLALYLFLPRCDASCEAMKHLVTAEYLQADGRLEEALVEYNTVIRLDPESAVAYRARGFAHDRLGELRRTFETVSPDLRCPHCQARRLFERAIEDYSAAIRLEPEDFKAYWGRSIAHDHIGQHMRAAFDHNRAVTLRGVETKQREWHLLYQMDRRGK